MKFFMGVFILAAVSFATLAEENKAQKTAGLAHSEAWKKWASTFGSSSPLLALRKNRTAEYQITDEQLGQILTGNQRVKFDPPLMSSKGPVSVLDVLQLDSFRRFELHLHGRRQDQFGRSLSRQEQTQIRQRFRTIRENMQKAIAQRSPETLQFHYVGETHALDLYFSQFLTPDLSASEPLHRIREEVLYVSMPAGPDTRFFSDDYYKFMSLFRGTQVKPDLFQENSKVYVGNFLARLAFNQRLRSGLVTKEDLLEESLDQWGAIVFMDWHQIDAAKVFRSMPSAATLTQQGIQEIELYFEGLKAGKDYELDDLERAYRFHLESFLDESDQNYYREFRPEVYSFLQRGFVSNQTLEAFHQKLREYHRAGIAVQLKGLEEVELWNPGPLSPQAASSSSDSEASSTQD